MPDRPFDPHWITEKPNLSSFLNALCRKLTDAEGRQRGRSAQPQANFEAAIKAIVLDLYRADESDPMLEVGIPMGTGALQKRADSHYGSIIFRPRSFTDAMRALLDGGHIKETTPFWDDPAKKNNRTARYKATSSLLKVLRGSGASISALRRNTALEGIRLKDKDKNLVEYGDIPFAEEARGKLDEINSMLQSHWYDLALSNEQLSVEQKRISGLRKGEATLPFDFAARTVYRVFNNGDWEQGGRFYGAWWISCPSRLRRHILIDGKRTVEVDFSGMHAAMLYAMIGKKIPKDPYKCYVVHTGSESERKLVKRTFNALLNADRIDRIGEIEGYSEELTGKSWKDFKKFIVKKYPKFSKFFCAGIGLKLQRKDSDIAEEVMMKFARKQYACLPVHDSFIVHHALKEDLIIAMQDSFETMFGAVGEVGYEMGLFEVDGVKGEVVNPDNDEVQNLSGYEARLEEYYEQLDLRD